MKRANLIYLAAFALVAAALALRLLLFMRMTKTDKPVNPPAPAYAAARSLSSGSPQATLFPGLNEQSVTSITVSTPDRRFDFRCEDPRTVSVNGHRADSEVFLTLLEQISQFPVDTRTAFAPEAQNLLLTLIVSSGAQQQIAQFYSDGHTGETTHIIVGKGDTSKYLMTGGWRVGALMMTCEGTRILDAHGNEQPAINKETVSIH